MLWRLVVSPLAPFQTSHPFATDHVGPGPCHGDLTLPTMKINQHFALSGLAAHLVVEVDQLLIIPLHEVNFDALDPPLLELIESGVKLIIERLPDNPQDDADVLLPGIGR